jgi:hypothetical protein
VRPDIPEDTVDARPRAARSARSEAAPGPSVAPAWDESLPEEMRAIVKAYFKR